MIDAPSEHVSTNFAMSILELPTHAIAIVLNASFPMMAFAEPPVAGQMRLRFVDSPEVTAAYEAAKSYEILAVAELELPLTPEMLRSLAAAERKQIDHWRPRTFGEVVFNYWD